MMVNDDFQEYVKKQLVTKHRDERIYHFNIKEKILVEAT